MTIKHTNLELFLYIQFSIATNTTIIIIIIIIMIIIIIIIIMIKIIIALLKEDNIFSKYDSLTFDFQVTNIDMFHIMKRQPIIYNIHLHNVET